MTLPDYSQNLSAAALVNAEIAASVGMVSVSSWYERVRKHEAPQPCVRKHRFTRWRLLDVLAYWERIASQGSTSHSDCAEPVTVVRARRYRAMQSPRPELAICKAEVIL